MPHLKGPSTAEAIANELFGSFVVVFRERPLIAGIMWFGVFSLLLSFSLALGIVPDIESNADGAVLAASDVTASEAEPGVDKFGCAWTLCSTRSGYGWPQRSQLQPGVPPLARCVTLQPATFWNLRPGDPLSSCNKRIVFISYSFFAWQIRIRCDRKTSRGLAFALRKSLRPKPTAII